MKINKILLATRGLRGLVASVLFAALAVPAPTALGFGAIWIGGVNSQYEHIHGVTGTSIKMGHTQNYSDLVRARVAARDACYAADFGGEPGFYCRIAREVNGSCHAYNYYRVGNDVTVIRRSASTEADAMIAVNNFCEARSGGCRALTRSFCDVVPQANTQPQPQPQPSGGGDSGGGGGGVGIALAGVAVVGLALYAFSGGDESGTQSVAPIFKYSNSDGTWEYKAGIRQEWNTENWLAYHQVARIENADNGVFSYNSGMDYFLNPFKLSLDSSGKGETITSKMSFALDKKFGNLEFSPNFAVEHQSDFNGNLVNYAANLETLWRIRTNLAVQPSFTMYGENPREFGDNAEFNLSAKYRF